MTEEFLHYIWKYRNFNQDSLHTTEGEPVEILQPGEQNSDAGPDFFNARIRIGQMLWVGNVEIHIRASDWNRHGHPQDPAYGNIILHVVHEADEWVQHPGGRTIPTLELNGLVPAGLYRKYLDFSRSKAWVPCGSQVQEVNPGILVVWLERLLTERLEQKSHRILESLRQNQNNWEETFYQYLARNMGFRVNALPFELLAKSCPLNLLGRYRDNLFQLEALLFGQAGLLEEHFVETYPQRLQSEYQFLAHKHELEPLHAHLWKFHRLRPMNFPSLRIAQFARVIQSAPLFSRLLDHGGMSELKKVFGRGVSEYWHTHFHFGKPSPPGKKLMGEEMIENIAINTLAPFLFLYARQKGEEQAAEKAFDLLSETGPENNAILREWKKLGLKARDGGRTQALIELKTQYCNFRRCLDCAIGQNLLKASALN